MRSGVSVGSHHLGVGRVLALAVSALVLVGGCSSGSQDQEPSPSPTGATATTDLTGFGVLYVNGVQRVSNWSDNCNTAGLFPTSGLTTTYDQARITYMVPEEPTGPNIVLVPGYGLAADIWMTTPDLRKGWAQMLYDAGYPVYVLSPPDRGESMPVDQINKCLAQATAKRNCTGDNKQSYYGQVGHAALEDAWPTWRFGPEYGVPYPDSQFPSLPLKENYVEQFGASFVPYLGTSDVDMVDNVVMNKLTSDSIEALLKKIGPSVVVLHSAAGTGGFTAAENDPAGVKALVAIETTKCPKNLPDGRSPVSGTPFLGIWGDHIDQDSPGGHFVRRESCQQMAKTLDEEGQAPAQVISLPDDLGIHGNSHMMMEDQNNEQIMGIITGWLQDNGVTDAG